jgi:hypothetical protein
MSVPLPAETNGPPYLDRLQEQLQRALDCFTPGLVMYNAGSDMLASDPLAWLCQIPGRWPHRYTARPQYPEKDNTEAGWIVSAQRTRVAVVGWRPRRDSLRRGPQPGRAVRPAVGSVCVTANRQFAATTEGRMRQSPHSL